MLCVFIYLLHIHGKHQILKRKSVVKHLDACVLCPLSVVPVHIHMRREKLERVVGEKEGAQHCLHAECTHSLVLSDVDVLCLHLAHIQAMEVSPVQIMCKQEEKQIHEKNMKK